MPLPVIAIPATIAIAKSAPIWASFVPAGISAAVAAVSGTVNRLVGNEYNRETQVMLDSKREEMQLTQLKFQYLQQKDTQAFQSDLQANNHEHQRRQQEDNQDFQLDLQNNSYDRQLDLQSNSHEHQYRLQKDNQDFQLDLQNNSYDRQLDLQSNSHEHQYRLQKDNQDFQFAMAQLSADRQAQLQEYIQSCNARMQKDSHIFLAWKWQEEKSLQLALAEYGRETQLIVATFNRQTNMQSIEENQILQNWPLILMPAQIMKLSDRMPLRVILSPPDVDYDKFANPNKDGNKRKLPDLEKGLSAGLRQFVSQHYGNQRAVQLLDGAWQSKKYRDGASIQALHSKLSTESILILQTSIDGDRLNFDYNFWSNDSEPINQSVLANHKFVDLLYDSAKERAKAWKKQRDLLIELGEDPAHHHQINNHNLALLEKEEKLAQAGIDITQIQSRYIPADEDFENFKEWLVTYHSFILALTTDCYYLVQGNITPLLPQILPQLFTVDRYPQPLELMLTSYTQTIDALALERSTIIPDLYLNLAATFQPFEDSTYARRCLVKSIQALLNLRRQISGLVEQDLEACLSALPNYLTTADREYVAKLNSLLTALEIDVQFDLVSICLQRGIDRAHQKDYTGAISEFTLLIALNPRLAPAYFNRGLAYSKLDQYPAAITDFIHHLDLVPNSPDTYSSRGNIYYKQKEYQLALQDYDRALQIAPNHPAALKGKDLAYQAIAAKFQAQEEANKIQAEKLRREQEEKNSKGKPFSFEVVQVNSRGEIIQREQKEARSITENLPQGVTLERVYIPGGEFLMGSPDGVGGANEHPQHQVTIAPFFMSKYPVTQAQWRAVASLPQEQRNLNSAPSHFKGDNRPVESVSWHDAVEFCARLSKSTGAVYRLPSEAEWEYACRAGTTTPYYFGATITTELVNHAKSRSQTTDVGIFPPNNFGLYDLHGNVWEWSADVWFDSYVGAPTDGSIWGKGNNRRSPLGGGSWSNIPVNCRSAFRNHINRDLACKYVGFRIVCECGRT